MIAKTERRQRTTLASTIPDTYNPWQTIRTFNIKKVNHKGTEIQNPTLRNYINNNTNKMLPLLKQKQRDNLTKQERIALKNLINNDQIIINKADKGSTVVVLSTTDYIKEGLKHLCDPTVYRKLNKDTTNTTKPEIKKFLSNIMSSKLMPW